MDIFQCINKKKSNVRCSCKRCKNNYDGICVNDVIMDKYKSSDYVLIEDCEDSMKYKDRPYYEE